MFHISFKIFILVCKDLTSSVVKNSLVIVIRLFYKDYKRKLLISLTKLV